MSASLQNKTAIITGAGQGIGLEICKLLITAGAKVILNDIDETLCKDASKQADPSETACTPFPGDSSNKTVINEMLKTSVDKYGKLDLVIANAGITLFGDFFSYNEEDFYRVMQVNLGGTFFLAQAATNQMIKQGTGGSLLFTSSVTGHQAHQHLAAYSMTKAAIEMLAKNLVSEVSKFNINVNCIAPGATLTERTLEDPEYIKTWSRITPMGRPASVKDIAKAAIFLVSDEARHITGQSLVIDGGWTSMSPSPY